MGEEPGKWKVGDALVEVWDAERADNPPPRTLIGKFFVYDGQRPVKAGARIFTYQELVDHPGGISWIQVPADHHLRSMRIAFGAGPSPRHLILMGRNGAGKTTLLRSLVEWLGQDNPWQNMTFQTLATLNVPIYYGRLGTFVPVGFTDQTTRLRVAANGGLFAYFPIQRSFSAAPV
ncbi:MAG TPA: hypothetical protein PKY30_14850, partial [Myxococcota bacterium]|nr:hypothetical protein [Myxococcota bacterium]